MKRWLALAALAPFAVFAQEAPKAEPVCVRAEIVPGFESFGRPETGAPAIGKAVALTLKRVDVPPPVAGARPFKPGTFAGAYLLTVVKAGTYRVALSQGAWISVLRAAGEAPSTAHGHGPACSGIAKIVSFDLAPGVWHLDLSEAKAAGITVAVVAN
ncbi:hypothetical protein Q4F19_05330 [Sphingomonas sp. BIUV-7]|uniref:Uncharacterized protein n=1 Tax=Sphingomonas natans TaxID=3063330 RepID=A0ABT8Y666_9SPHN|nr:hypothetical protein [Sphingomonas sp. BIUV-7]MDO6413796.1 hypothetical protein [Sphingomonas sp. BIUV-7]